MLKRRPLAVVLALAVILAVLSLLVGGRVRLATTVREAINAMNKNASHKAVSEFEALYPIMLLEDLMTSSEVEYIVHGIVIKRQTAEMRKIPTINGGGYFAERPETAVTVRVKEILKGTVTGGEIIYHEDGGEFENMIITPEGGALQPGEEVILFLNKYGYGWGDQSVYRIQNGRAVPASKGGPEMDIAEMKRMIAERVAKAGPPGE